MQEIFDELKSVLSGKTLDAIFPPLIFVIVNAFGNLNLAAILALLIAAALTSFRAIKKQSWKYALGGFVGVAIAGALAYFTKSATSYYLPALISSTFIVLSATLSIILGKPLAAWTSHLTRAWPINWYWLPQVKPAYTEVTLLWSLLFILRLAVQIQLYLKGDATSLGWTNIILGWPFTIIILVISYMYRIWRLCKLGGPSVDEYKTDKLPPWLGQTRGF